MKDQQNTLHKQQIQITFYVRKSLKSLFFADNKPQNMRLIVRKAHLNYYYISFIMRNHYL